VARATRYKARYRNLHRQAAGHSRISVRSHRRMRPRDLLIAAAAVAAVAGGGGGAVGALAGGGGGTPPGRPEAYRIGQLMRRLGAPDDIANVDSMAAWIQHETPWPPVASYNPMNTTLPEPGSTCFNSVCVRNYAGWPQGIAATAATLTEGYPEIVSALQSGSGICGVAPDEFSKWSDGGYSAVC
jgi:hypothetical protein